MALFRNENEAPVLIGAYGNSKAEADALFRNGYYRKAIDSYTNALTHRPNDILSLVFRSRCHLLLGDINKASQDAEAALNENKTYYLSIFQKAEVLFNKGDFEMALVFYHRGNKQRPEFHNFRLGIRKAQEAIYNCVGTPERVKLNTSGDLSFFAANIEKKTTRKGALCTQTPRTVQRGKRPSEKIGNEKTIKQMLGDLYGDRQFLEKILKDIDTQTRTGRKVYNFANDGLTYLDKLADFWQQVKPIYARKYETRLALNRGRSAKISAHDYIYNQIEKIEHLMADGNHEATLARAEKVLNLLNEYSESQLSCKMQLASTLHSIMGNAYMELNDYENAIIHHSLDLAIAEQWYIDQAELRALDNLGRAYARNGEYQKAIDVWERKLPLSKGQLEIAWLCHELGRCYLELDQTKVAKEYGTRSLTVANEVGNDKWKLHAYVLISQAQVKSGRLSSALINFENAAELASLQRDFEAREAIMRAIDDVNDRIQKREMAPSLEPLEDAVPRLESYLVRVE
ncbi:unnamed protein product [Candidula unifasciata]|uniref:Outer dynein arm-docking complex subunit 4 n=1 Tax=Candidula unifasciata TaxID=100452 RepID=A0A8S3YTH8_9EUPU|nr:unnamed protein product [Candidula unifasciata]